MEGLSTPPPLYSRLPPTPPTPLHGSSYDSLVVEKKSRENEKEKSLLEEAPCEVSPDAFFSLKKMSYDDLKKKNKVLDDMWEYNLFMEKKHEKEDILLDKVFKDDKVLFYDEKNPFFKPKDVYKSVKEPVKKPGQPCISRGLSFVFRGKKIIRSFDKEIHDLKPRRLFQEKIMSSLSTALNEVEDEFTPTKRRKRKSNVQIQN
ncbi:hypothetical protein PORY_002018 [Pneumocystis oryctolagi]|uniref:Uncharacterized protein n=1 Tax=Pneumocystis oryctolagi TaxID=42067 RepID=A0ACB7CAX1_9ASCO|nr:hypothetical protein PORY_002018 [Pneumocystis oryctolagi]